MTLAFRNRIDVTLSVADRRITCVDIQPRTRPPLGRLAAGKPVETLLAALPRLFSLCATAHQVALLTAVEAARGQPAAPLTRHRRIKAVLAERVAELLRGLLLGPLAGDRGTLPTAQRLLQAVACLQQQSRGEGPGPSRAETLSQIKMALGELGIGSAAESFAPGTPLARLMAAAGKAAENGGWRHMPSAHGLLSAADDRAVVTRLMENGAAFADAPELDGRIPETGVWARHAGRSPRHAGPAERLSVRIAELAALVRWIEDGETEDDVAEEDLVAGYGLGPGRGAAAVECARGRLHHVVELDARGDIARFEYLAPTEWNFHPRGPVATSLTGAMLRGAEDRDLVHGMIASFDPCVGFGLTVREMADA
ncbi:nickel-dependent hydrogenase large subunit [Bradyrhizobium sp. STM 3809]|uniref:nickel-dependent hydrogenase large subunit n=1 Tax=Bradyrhizobium sp. STM 3809 TaxID=551936 RepID=UPI000240658A|nr:nickel-dependent hydrogenase large subunit [Bradyrhizobium sp. STM 3809]CCD98757.1 Hydrogenase expression/formation protein hupK [Bradyrhizobium sp. STM 3809]